MNPPNTMIRTEDASQARDQERRIKVSFRLSPGRQNSTAQLKNDQGEQRDSTENRAGHEGRMGAKKTPKVAGDYNGKQQKPAGHQIKRTESGPTQMVRSDFCNPCGEQTLGESHMQTPCGDSQQNRQNAGSRCEEQIGHDQHTDS